ncbi:MAG: hypothetical protein K1X64_03275 [Myxococcaceae bacterium]|nr:hypothetical protein [Myxococcaceae bacterium]
MPIVPPPSPIPFFLRPFLWLAKRITGKENVPGLLLAWFPKGAIGAGVFELSAAGAPKDMEARVLAVARIASSAVTGCPFCLDMNAATYARVGLQPSELKILFSLNAAAFESLGPREAAAAHYAVALTRTPVVLSKELVQLLQERFSPKEIVILAATIAQVNYWSRFNQGLGIPRAGFFDDAVCPLPSAQ